MSVSSLSPCVTVCSLSNVAFPVSPDAMVLFLLSERLLVIRDVLRVLCVRLVPFAYVVCDNYVSRLL